MADPAQKRDTLTEDGQHSEDAGDSQLPTDNGSSSDDDDWFNKSLDDFEIPAATVKSDRWDNEDEDEPEEEGPQRPDTGRGTSARSGSASARTAGASKPDKQEQKREKGLNGGSRISDAAGQAEDDSSPEKRTPSPGEEAGGDEGQRPEEDKGKKIPGIRRIFGPLLVLKPTSRQGREPAGEDGAWAPVKEEESAEEAEVPEERDEEWFLRNLKELPTMFNLIRVHSLPTARLLAIQTMLANTLGDACPMPDDDNVDECTSIELSLMENDEGDFNEVLKIVVRNTDGDQKHTKGTQMMPAKVCNRSNYLASLLPPVLWLMGRRPEAEAEAHRVLRKYPLSLVARANTFYILWKKGAKAEAAAVLKPLVNLRRKWPQLYENILWEEQGDLGLSYTELGPEFIPDALVALEAVVCKNPKWNRFKWFWALNLRRLTNARHNWSTPITDVVTPLLKAVDLLLEIIRSAEEEGSLEMKAAAAAELGDILHRTEFDEELKNTVGKRGLDAGLDAAKCFDIAMQVEDRGGSNLVRAGKFFRYTGQLKKSEKALKKAVAVQDSSKVHHQLALTLRRMALEEKRRAWQNIKNQPGARRAQLLQLLGPRRGASRQSLGVISWARKRAGDTKMAELERPMKAQMYMSLCREDKHVNEAMHHFNKALMLSHGENGEAAYDLGLMYKALGEYRDALEQFLAIVDIEDEPVNVVRAFEQSGLVKLEMCSREENETAARRLQESGRTLMSMAILVQARIVRDFRTVMGHRDHDIWRSLHSLGQYLHQLDVEGVSEEDSTAELWLLRLLRVYADTAPVLISLQQYSPRDAEDVQAVGDKLRKYLRDQRHEDAVLFSVLLHLTHQGRVLDSGLRDLVLRAHARAARKRLLSDLEEGNAGTTFNACMAKMLFRWAFEDTYPAPDDAHSAHGDAHPAPADGHPASTTDDAHLPQTTADAHPAPADVHPASTTDDVPPASVATEAHLPQTTTDAHQAPANAHEAPASTHLPQSTAEAHPASTINDAPPFPDDAQPTTDDTHPTTDGAHPASTTCDAPPLPDDAHPTTDDANAAHSDELRDEASSLHAAANEDSGQERGSAEAPGNTPLENHVLLIHDPHDPEATHAAQLLRPALQTTYGLRAGLAEQDSSEVMMRTTLGAMSRARLLLFILGSADISPELETYISEATRGSPAMAADTETTLRDGEGSPRMRRNLLILTLDNSKALPSVLQNHSAFPWRPHVAALAACEDQGARGKRWLESVGRFFCFLVGEDVIF